MIQLSNINNYPGGKNHEAAYKTIISHMPPHDCYIELFLGSGAVMKHKQPATVNYGIDIDPAVIDQCNSIQNYNFHNCCALDFIKDFPFKESHLIYADPPYLIDTRTKKSPVYDYEFMAEEEHIRLLEALKSLNCMVIISGYDSKLYRTRLKDWNVHTYKLMTRGSVRTEHLWYNFPSPKKLHDYSFVGKNYIDRQRIKRKINTTIKKLETMPPVERNALLTAIKKQFF